MTELTVKDLLASGRPLHRADVLTVAEVLAHQLADEHSRGRWHGDVGPHTVLLALADPAAAGVQDARLTAPDPAHRPRDWPRAPEGRTPSAAGDIFALGQLLLSLDAATHPSPQETDGLPFVGRLIDPDPARRPTAQDLLTAFDEDLILAPTAHQDDVAAADDVQPHTPVGRPPSDPVSPPRPAPAEATAGSAGPLALAALAVFALLLGGGLWWSGQDEPVPPARAISGEAQPAGLVGGDQGSTTADQGDAGTDWATQSPSTGRGGDGPIDGGNSGSGSTGGDDAQGTRTRPEVTFPPGSDPGPEAPSMEASQAPVAEGDTEFDQAWCRSHGEFVVRVQTVNYRATICRDGDSVNYYGVNLIDGLTIRTPATEHSTGWTGHGEDNVTYEVSRDVFEVRQGDSVLASEEVNSFTDQAQNGDHRPWDLHLTDPISFPACDGGAIVVVDTFYNLQGVSQQVRESVAAHPGADYLNTDASCDSLQHPTDQRGNQFLIYYWAGHEEAEICDLVESTGTHGLWLRDDVDPLDPVECG